jgi:hypothetical protein
MTNKLEVSFNSPQCGWMSIGFSDAESEFHTTTAHEPHSRALSEILRGLSSLIDAQIPNEMHEIEWSRNPEAYSLFFRGDAQTVHFQVVEYPTFDRLKDEGEIVFSHNGSTKDFCESFYQTFAQLYEDRETDEFEFNWRQPFPFEEFAELENKLKNYGQ